MSLRSVQRQAAARYTDLGSDLSSTLRPQRPVHRTSELPTTTRLLRNSRLFSLPKPLKRPDTSQNGGLRNTNDSESATLPYPTHASIITTAKSLGRGDWGLKRQLPTKAFETSTPVARVKHVDTIDHITEFESAADHVFTLQKIQELAIPIIVPKTRDQRRIDNRGNHIVLKAPTSAFDASADPKELPQPSIDPANAVAPGASGWGVSVTPPTEVRRWRYDSPWIAGMSPGDFEAYVRSTIKSKRSDFREWLHRQVAEKRSQGAKSDASMLNVDAGFASVDAPESRQAASGIISEVLGTTGVPAKGSLEEEILELRNNPTELYKYVWEFFDLPGRFPSATRDLTSYTNDNVDVEQGPPTTHPSAGLSYLRPVRHLYNHPALGPREVSPPVPARVLQRPGQHNRASRQTLGIAGVAVERVTGDFRNRDHLVDEGTSVQGLKVQGGPKLWAHVESAEINSKGGIRLNISKANDLHVVTWYPKAEGQSNTRRWGAGKQQMADINRSAVPRPQMPNLTTMPEYKKIE